MIHVLLQEAQLADEDIFLGAIEHDRLILVLRANLSIWLQSFGAFLFHYIPALNHLHQHVVLCNILNFLIPEVLLVEWTSYLQILVQFLHALKAQVVVAGQQHGRVFLQIIFFKTDWAAQLLFRRLLSALLTLLVVFLALSFLFGAEAIVILVICPLLQYWLFFFHLFILTLNTL